METEDYFFDNQALDLQNEFQMVGYVHTWRFIKQTGWFTKHDKRDGLGKKLGKDCPLIMPK